MICQAPMGPREGRHGRQAPMGPRECSQGRQALESRDQASDGAPKGRQKARSVAPSGLRTPLDVIPQAFGPG